MMTKSNIEKQLNNQNDYYDASMGRGKSRGLKNQLTPNQYIDKGKLRQKPQTKQAMKAADDIYREFINNKTRMTCDMDKKYAHSGPARDEPNGIYSLRESPIDWDKIERENRRYEKRRQKKGKK